MIIERQQGIVLVIVLWVVTLLAVMATGFAYSMRTETVLATHNRDRAQLRALAEAGVNYAIMRLLSVNPALEPQQLWPTDGTIQELRFGPGQVRVSVVDAAGLVDLNTASRELLGSLLAAAGVADDAREGLLDMIEDWRDPDDLPRLSGAESSAYQAAGRPGPKNAPFESVEELQQVLGITPALYGRLAPALTVFSEQPGIDPAVAPGSVVRILADVDPAAVEEYLTQRGENIALGLPPPDPPASLQAALSSGQGAAYHISATAYYATGASVSVQTVMVRELGAGLPYRLRLWRQS